MDWKNRFEVILLEKLLFFSNYFPRVFRQ